MENIKTKNRFLKIVGSVGVIMPALYYSIKNIEIIYDKIEKIGFDPRQLIIVLIIISWVGFFLYTKELPLYLLRYSTGK
ncbi:MAG: hypothetical protein IPL65_01165 [Lewinellaceae bacterium]|nr:hypothetical protein [Lewinellaceae bacterium]